MKHWDGRDQAQATPQRLSPRDRKRVRELFREPPRPRRTQPQVHSMIGLVLAVSVLAGLAWLLTPSSPISPDLMN